MLTKFRILTLTLVAPLTLAYQIQVPSKQPVVGQPMTIKWTKGANDPPTFTIELQNPVFNNDLALATFVDGSLNEFTVPALQSVKAGPNYVIRFVKEDNINQSFGESSSFSISDAVLSTTSSSSSGTSTTGTGTKTSISGTPTTPLPTSTSGFGNTLSRTDSLSTSSTASAPQSSGSGAPINSAFSMKSSVFGLFSAVMGVVLLAH